MVFSSKICWNNESGQRAEITQSRELAHKGLCYFCFLSGESRTSDEREAFDGCYPDSTGNGMWRMWLGRDQILFF